MGVNKVIYYGEVLVDMSQVTVTPETLGKGATALDAKGELITGLHECKETEPKLQSKTVTPTNTLQTVNPDSGYDGLSKVTVNAMPTATQATPSITVSSTGLITAKATQSAGYVASGTKQATKQLTTQAAKTVTPSTSSQTAVASGVYTTGAVIVSAIPNTYVKPTSTKAATTYTPTTSNQTIVAGTYCSGAQTIKGDANLVAENIAEGVSIFGVTGTHSAGGSGSADIETCTLTVSADSTLKPVLAFTTYENGEISTNYAIGVPPNTVVSNNIVKNSMVHVANASLPNIMINAKKIGDRFYNAFKIIGDAIVGWKPCFARNTLILLSNKTTKFIQDITYQDELLVWDFDNGCYSSAKPLWIKKAQTANYYYLCKFANGVELKLIGSDGKCHRIFDIEKGRFESATDCVGKRVMSEHGETTLLSCERMDEEVEFYNIITYKHINLYAEGVLTSCRLNNIYPIENMKFVKDNRTKKLRADYPNIDSNMFCGLRIAEQPLSNEEINAYVSRLYALTDYKCH